LNAIGFSGLLKRRDGQTPKSEKTKKSFWLETGDGDVVHGVLSYFTFEINQ
jgi:hypothetical protein